MRENWNHVKNWSDRTKSGRSVVEGIPVLLPSLRILRGIDTTADFTTLIASLPHAAILRAPEASTRPVALEWPSLHP
jgi:hypothetical protein